MRTINLKAAVLAAILVACVSGTAKAYDPHEEKLKREFYERMDAENRRTGNMGMDAWIRDTTGMPTVIRPGVVPAPRAINPIRVAPYVPAPLPAWVADSVAVTNSKEARDAHFRDLMNKSTGIPNGRAPIHTPTPAAPRIAAPITPVAPRYVAPTVPPPTVAPPVANARGAMSDKEAREAYFRSIMERSTRR